MPELKESRIAIGNIEARCEDDINTGHYRCIQDILIANDEGDNGQCGNDGQPYLVVVATGNELIQRSHYTALIRRPRSPWGRSTSTSTSTRNATMSR